MVIHHSATTDGDLADAAAFRRHHVEVRKWRDLGYHFVCERVGEDFEILAGRPLNVPGAHCPGMNSRGIGFCFAGNFEVSPPPDGQLDAAARFLAGLLEQLWIDPELIVPHGDHRPTACPGAAFPLEELRGQVRSHLG